MAKEQVFREKSLERVSSPEKLDEYVKVTNPSVWALLITIIFLLIGVCAWGIFGTLDTYVDAVGIVDNGEIRCYVAEEDVSKFATNTLVKLGDNETTVISKSSGAVRADDVLDNYEMHLGGFTEEEWLVEIICDSKDFSEGVYEAKILVDSVHPASFVTN